MKKISYLIALFSLTFGSVMAQEIQSEEVTLKKVEKGEMPEAVLKSVEKDFPDIKVVEYAMLPIEQYKEQWAIVEEHNDMKTGEKPQYFQIGMKGNEMKMIAIYNQYGQLQKSKEIRKHITLPPAILTSIANDYKGWKIAEDKELIKNGKGKVDFYTVKVANGKEKKTLYLNPEGKFLEKNHKSV